MWICTRHWKEKGDRFGCLTIVNIHNYSGKLLRKDGGNDMPSTYKEVNTEIKSKELWVAEWVGRFAGMWNESDIL